MAKPKDKQPWFKFYPQDWRGDAKLRMCSIGARGLWAEMLCVMHEAEPYGYLTISGKAVTPRQMAALAGVSQGECMKYMLELASAGVYSIDDDKTIFSRRMVRDKAKADKDRENGKGGGNPRLKGSDNGWVNPPDKAQMPEAKFQNSDSKNREREHSPSNGDFGRQEGEATLITDKYEPSGPAVEYAYSLGMKKIDLETELGKFRSRAVALRQVSFDHDMSFKLWCDRWLQYQKKNFPERYAEAVSAPAASKPKVFVESGTLAWQCWQMESRRTGGRGYPCVTHRVDHVSKEGFWFETEFPKGYDEQTGERLPAGEEHAA